MSIVITPNIPLVAAQGATADVVLQPGSVISAKVLQILGGDQVKISIAGQALDVQSQVPLQAGQTLQLQVSQTQDGGIALAVVSQQGGAAASQSAGNSSAIGDTVTLAPGAVTNIAAPVTSGTTLVNQLTALETSAVSAAAQTAATQQTSLATLFANLGVAAGLTGLPPQVQQAMAQVLAQQTSLDPSLTGDDIKQAFQSSGLFLEASLASGSVASSGAVPDLKAALIVLRQVLTTSIGSAPVTAGTSVATTTGLLSTTASAASQSATAAEIVMPEGVTPTIAEATATAQAGTIAGAIAIEQGAEPSVAVSQPVTIIAGPETPMTASPSIAPSLTSGAAASTASSQTAALEVASDILDLSAASQVISSAATPADAAARAAVSGAALNLLQEAVQGSPLAAGNLSKFAFDNSQTLALLPAVMGARTLGVDDAEFARSNLPPPPLNGALPAAQPVLPATLISKAPVDATLQHLLSDTDGAIARQTLLQVASLPGQPDAATGRVDPTTPRWNFEIPFATPQGTAMAQFDISRDGGGREPGAAKPVWRARFSLDVEPAGPVHAMISLSGDKTSVRMWAERPATAMQLRAGVSQLSQALSRAELQPGDIVVRDGAPVQPVSAPTGHFLDRAL
ncbi:flagellar hook-length control protein FliK [Bradyrhizobium sp. dw_411]|uniref:flagellar hook-length control protein FliK n=1 Tax=Bradyrhizobium sp. dw_411 TaxID=2720082 RepID=UPI001BCFE47E|nr:flagellar hook-length control protein FliK [Bradyrhizobium sp. dw_411]